MKFNYIIIFIIIILINYSNINFIQVCNGALSQEENLEAISIIQQITGTTVTDPCIIQTGYSTSFFTCTLKSDGTGQHYVSVFRFLPSAKIKTVTSTFGVFKQIKTITTYIDTLLPNIFNEIDQLTNLTSLSISNQNTEIPSNVILPSSLSSLIFNLISVRVPESIFNSSLSNLVFNIGSGFSLPSNLPLNNNLKDITVTVTSTYNQLPSNIGTALVGLKSMTLRVVNDRSDSGYVDYDFPTISHLPNLNFLMILFLSSSYNYSQTWEFPPSLLTYKSLNRLEIQGEGFKMLSQNYLDFTLLQQGLLLSIVRSSLFETCNSTCLKLPKDSTVSMFYSNINMDYFNFTNVVNFRLEGSNINQPLPNHPDIDYENMKSFRIVYTEVSGPIPNEYCKFKKGVLVANNNPSVTTVPSCYTCVGGNFDGSNNILNSNTQYDNFNSSSPPTDCPSYSFSNYNGIAKTNKATSITIQGKDFGWSFNQVSPPPSSTPSPLDPSLSILLANSAVLLTIPKGEGVNKNLTASFGYNYRFTQVFNYSYEEPVLLDYQWIPINKTSSQFILIGTGFSYINSNTINFNDTEYSTDIAIESDSASSSETSLGHISFTSNGAINQTVFVSLFVISGGQISNYLNSSLISINTTNQHLNITGGTITLNIIFGGTGSGGSGGNTIINKDQLSISINNIQCEIDSTTSNTITIQYPQSDSIGSKELIINAGGFQFNTNINYINNTLSNENSNDDSNDDEDKTNIGIIVGPIIGGIALLAIISIIIVVLIKKKSSQRSSQPSIQLKASQAKLYVGGKVENIDKF